jgi:hypothetical protein
MMGSLFPLQEIADRKVWRNLQQPLSCRVRCIKPIEMNVASYENGVEQVKAGIRLDC